MTKQEIGSILMKLREKSGKSREEVADLLGKSVKTIGHWETGYAQPDANTLFLLCTIYDADLSTSFGFSAANEKSPSTAEAAPGDDVAQIFDYLNDGLVRLGFIRDGEDITDQQAEILLGICSILRAAFEQQQ